MRRTEPSFLRPGWKGCILNRAVRGRNQNGTEGRSPRSQNAVQGNEEEADRKGSPVSNSRRSRVWAGEKLGEGGVAVGVTVSQVEKGVRSPGCQEDAALLEHEKTENGARLGNTAPVQMDHVCPLHAD